MSHEGTEQNGPVPRKRVPGQVPDMSTEPHDTAAPGDDSTLEDIRDLLFGTYIQDYERRLANLEARLQQVTVDLHEELRRRCDALEHEMKSEFQSLHAQLRTEQEQYVSRHALQALLLDQSTHLTNAMQQKYTEILALLEEKLLEMHHDKSALAGLSTLFCETALRLKQTAPSHGAAVNRTRRS